MSRFIVSALMIFACDFAFARRLPEAAKSPGARTVEINAAKTEARARFTAPVGATNVAATMPQLNAIIGGRTDAEIVIENCAGPCDLAKTVEDILIHNGAKRDLSGRAMRNVIDASGRAAELTNRGLNGEVALQQAFTEMGLRPEEVKRDCL